MTFPNQETPATQELPEDKIGGRIKSAREKKGLTHDSLSQLTRDVDSEGKGIARTTVRSYELGVYKPGSRELRILSVALEVSPTWLVLGTPESGGVAPHGDASTIEHLEGSNPKISTAKYLQSLYAFLRLDLTEREAMSNVMLSLLRAKVGEVEFRKKMAALSEIGETLKDLKLDMDGGLFATGLPDLPKDLIASLLIKHKDLIGDLIPKSMKNKDNL